MRRAAAPRGTIALLAIVVGSMAAGGSGVDGSSPSPQRAPQTIARASHRPPPLRVRASAAPIARSVAGRERGGRAAPAAPSSAAVTASRLRGGGAVDDDGRGGSGGYDRRAYDRRGDDRGRPPPPPRHSSPRYGNYDEGAGRPRQRSGPRGPPREDPRGGADRRRGEERRGGGHGPAGPRRGEGGGGGRYDGSVGNRGYGGSSYGPGEGGGGRKENYDRNPRYAEPDAAIGSDGDKKRKSWFSLKKDKAKASADKERKPLVPPPPPAAPPPGFSTDIHPADTERTPIHYVFPAAADAEEIPFADGNDDAGAAGADRADYADERRRPRRGDDGRAGASARRDAVTAYMATRGGGLRVRLGSVMAGAALGGFLGKSLLNDPVRTSIATASLLFLTGFLRNDYGELSRALGLALVLALSRARAVRREYPTLPHLKALIRQGPRRPFPPAEGGTSAWKYEPVYRDDPEFSMPAALLALVLVGAFCGGTVPVLPAWMGGLAGAAVGAASAAGANARGDLGRAMGMRVVGLVRLAPAINRELRVLGKAATVGGRIFDKVMIMDRKHRIKDKIVAVCTWGYEKVAKTADEAQEDVEGERPERRPERRGPPPRRR